MTSKRSFLPNDTAILVLSSDSQGVNQHVNSTDWRDELKAYNNERDIRRLMMNRTGVCG